ncbi:MULTISPECIES: pitrilysin family protein [unclassified Polaromonas]|uniref:M16 family metallopeptidase n=1 Tax=unclassified Polaromonas TaxID=2638319 RepID=UPI0018CA0625|nr:MULTISPECIES: pitrilysin family protein [unclassified Polaromonas]MBG6071974.1 zinc protease [Polaromonas sp. CG_9.7]MBG6113976.1 zinc protease [Polaromonas sp. CG_9.2]MDH6183894.1 zinc protease [Polaromonas sp. CG_23.6]
MTIATKKIAACAMAVCATGLFVHNSAQAAIPVQHWTQASGAQVYLVESPAIAMVDVQLDFDAGSRRDPPGQAGLASLTANMLEKGVREKDGAPALDENALGEAWADLGANFGAGASADRMSFSLRSLTDPALLDQAVALAARQIAEPAYPDAVWQRERQRLDAALKESYTRPASVVGRAYAKAVYGNHPYGYEMTEATLANISVADLQAAHAVGVVACRARVSLVGAVTRAQADAMAARLLSRLPSVSCASLPPLPAVPDVAPLAQAENITIPFDSAQAQVLIGQPGFKRADLDYFPMTVGNYILGGGGFVSRLTNEVREKRGLTYGISSAFSPGLHAGSFTVGLQTRPDQAAQAVQIARQVVGDFVASGPTEAELKAAKDNLVGGFALRIDSNRKLLANLAGIAWNDLPLDYLDTWTQQVEKVSVADIKAAFARKVQPDKMVTVILGAAK